MRTRTVQIIIEENADGQKKRVGKIFQADALLLMAPLLAGTGLLAILNGLVKELDGKPVQSPAPPPPPAPAAKPTPSGMPLGMAPGSVKARFQKKPVDAGKKPA